MRGARVQDVDDCKSGCRVAGSRSPLREPLLSQGFAAPRGVRPLRRRLWPVPLCSGRNGESHHRALSVLRCPQFRFGGAVHGQQAGA